MADDRISVTNFDSYSIKTTTLDLNELYKIVDTKTDEFYKLYHVPAKYIKIPTWVYKALSYSALGLRARPVGNGLGKDKIETIFGYIVCPTPSIERVEDIEVF